MEGTEAVGQDSGSAAQTLLTQPKKGAGKSKAGAAKGDFLVLTASEIENLSKDSAFIMADALLNSEGENDFRLGGVLAVIQDNGWFSVEGYESFKAMIEQKFGLKYRKAMYLIGNYNNLVKSQIPWDKVKDLGWTKLSKLSSILTAENVDEWVEKAKVYTVLQLEDAIKQSLTATPAGGEAVEGDTVTSTVTTMTFKLHNDQKEVVREALDKAKAEANTEFDTVALEAICLAYLGNSIEIKTQGDASLKDVMAQHTYEEALQIFSELFPDVDVIVKV